MKSGTLFVVATPIGNYQDITLRALQVLQDANVVVCEELREGSTLLKKVGVDGKELVSLNEHNEDEQTGNLIIRLHKGESLALISDCGTPTFADPGARLVEEALQQGVKVVPIPGPSSLMAALSITPSIINEFYFAGFLPRKDEERISKLKHLHSLKNNIILMDTPYRLRKLLEEAQAVFGRQHQATLTLDLTLPGELIIHDTLQAIQSRVAGRKGEFVLIIHR